MGNLENKEKFIFANMFFYHRIYLNGKQIFLDDKCLGNLEKILDELIPKNIEELYSQINIKKLLGNILPEDSELLNPNNNCEINFFLVSYLEDKYNKLFPIYNFFSPSSDFKITKETSLFKFCNLKKLDECEKFKILEYQPSKKFEKDFQEYMSKKAKDQKVEGKSFYSILIIGIYEMNKFFINGFLNFLFDVKDDDNYRLALELNNNEEKEGFYGLKYINSEKGDFVFFCINVDKINNFEIGNLIENFKYIEKETINIIIFNRYEADSEPDLEITESEKHEIFFACPSISFNILKYHILEKEFKFMDKFTLYKNNSADQNLIKETILQMVKCDEIVRQKFTSCNFNYDSIYNPQKEKDIFFKYNITMEGYKYLYNIITERKNSFIDFSSFIKFLTISKEKSDEIKNKEKIFKEKNGEIWTEYHIYEIKIANLEKEIEGKKKEKKDIENQKKDEDEDFDKKIELINREIENLKLYRTYIEKDAKLLLPVSSEKIGEKKYEKNYKINVCQNCKFNCHVNCDEIIHKFCKSFKFTFNGFKCQVCPNKCYSNSHEVVRYQYPNYEYKKIDEILKPYFKDDCTKKMIPKFKLEKAILRKEEEKRKITEVHQNKKNNLDIIIDEINSYLKSRLEAIELVKDKKNKIYDDNRKKLDDEIKKSDKDFNQLTKGNLKSFEKLFISCLNHPQRSSSFSFSFGGRCC